MLYCMMQLNGDSNVLQTMHVMLGGIYYTYNIDNTYTSLLEPMQLLLMVYTSTTVESHCKGHLSNEDSV